MVAPNLNTAALAVTLFIAPALLFGCGEKKVEAKVLKPRPVRVIRLQELNPVKALQLTGAVKPWKEEDVAFEVSGRVQMVRLEGANLVGHWEEDGSVKVEGDVLATIDPRQYRIARDTARAAVEVARERQQVAEVELRKALPASVKAAAADRDRAEAELTRYKQAAETKAVSEVDVIRARADRDAKQALYEHALASIDAKKAEIESLKANVRQTEAQLEDAEFNLSRCTLYAPFPAEIAQIYLVAGGYAQAGRPVAHLVMMDPIQVDISVSQATAARLRIGDLARLYLPDGKELPTGRVFEKATVADPKTRTFRISIMTRNRRTVGDLSFDDPLLKRPRITQYMFLMRARSGDPRTPYVVDSNHALRGDDRNGYYVWAAPGVKRGDPIDPKRPVLTLKKFPVKPGKGLMNVQGILLVRELIDIGELEPGTLIAIDAPEDFQDGGQVVVGIERWHLTPGQLVPVVLGADTPKPGLYLPMDSIRPIDPTSGEIFLAEDRKARLVKVKILGQVGELFRIEALSPDDAGRVASGAEVISDYIHYLNDGEPIRAVKTREVKP
jgi:multidrug resistance efflux pump